MANSTFTGVIRSGKDKDGQVGVVMLVAEIAFDPTQTSALTGFVFPAGSVITGITSLGGATGGTAPTVDIGTTAGGVEIANELDADTAGTAGTLGAAGWVKMTVDTPVYAGVGASAATGGTTTIAITYYRT